MTNEKLTTKEASERYKIPVATIQAWRNSGRIKPIEIQKTALNRPINVYSEQDIKGQIKRVKKDKEITPQSALRITQDSYNKLVELAKKKNCSLAEMIKLIVWHGLSPFVTKTNFNFPVSPAQKIIGIEKGVLKVLQDEVKKAKEKGRKVNKKYKLICVLENFISEYYTESNF